MKLPFLNPPKQPRLPIDHEKDDAWSPYPDHDTPTRAHTACVFNAFCELNCIHLEIARSLFLEENRPPGIELEQEVAKFHQRLQRWRSELPSCISADNLSVPHILSLQ